VLLLLSKYSLKSIMFKIQKLNQLTGHKDSVYTLAAIANTNIIFSAAADGYVVRWSLSKNIDNQLVTEQKITEQEVIGKVIAKIGSSIYALHLIPEKNYLVVGHNTDGIHIIDLVNEQEIFSAGFTKSAIFDIKHLGSDLFIACGDGNVIIIDLANFSLKKILSFSQQSARCIAICSQKNEIAIGYSDNHIRIFDSINYTQKADFEAHTNSVFTLAYSPDNQYLLSGSRDAHLKIWQVQQENNENRNNNYILYQDIVAHLFTINHLVYSPNGEFFATCSKDKSIKLWQSSDFRLVKVIDKGRHAGHGTSINKLLWLDNHILISCSDDRTIVIWEINRL
jgi:WD40 repeat protein